MLILSSPSGAGKTSIAHHLLNLEPELELSVSATTRPKRESEESGRDYHFITSQDFDHLVAHGEFLEHAFVFDHHYGTLRQPVEQALNQGCDVLFDIDWQGTQQLAQVAPADLVTIFILPPSLKELEERLKTRAQDPPSVVAYRMSKAHEEISHWAEYDYVIINQDLQTSVQEIQKILHVERMKKRRQTNLVDFVKTLHT
jgi:guanylate kinase